MRRIYGGFAYSDAPRAGCFWDHTADIPACPPLGAQADCDVAIIGGGFTGVSAALHLAEAGLRVTLLEAKRLGWGASGRNGGFCCLGGGMLDDAALDRQFGAKARIEWRRSEVAAIRLVEALIARHGIEVDRHSDGETCLAHRPRDFAAMQGGAARAQENYGVTPRLIGPDDMASEGMNAPFHGGLTLPVGFGLNPRKYLAGLVAAAQQAGAQLHETSAVTAMTRRGGRHVLRCADGGEVTAQKVIIGTNGYSSEDLPGWFAGRYLPTQSSVLVTRPLSAAELDAQGWTSAQACYDTRHLLHYFRLMPDRRMLFGVRGGILATPAAEARALARARRDFERMFPAWSQVETPFGWSGMVSIARQRMPFVGPVPDAPGLYAGLCYHGNGVAMASYCGALLADLVQGAAGDRIYPRAVQRPLARFELGRFRRALLPPAYLGYALSDL